jgi:hypothetical protein
MSEYLKGMHPKSTKTSVIMALVFFFIGVQSMSSQDSTSVAKPSAKDFGLMIGASHVQLWADAAPYYLASTQQNVTMEGKSKNGLSIGMFYNFAIHPKWMIRPTVEAHIANTQVVYDTGSDYDEQYSVFPITIETPIALVYGINQRGSIESRGWRGSGLMIAARPVIPVSIFNSSYPVTKPFTMNIDFGLSIPSALRKTIMRTELFASINVMGIQGEPKREDFRTEMIQDLRRHFIGLRLYFN